MGIIRSTENLEAEIEEFRKMLMLGIGTSPWKRERRPISVRRQPAGDTDDRLVFVTSAISFLGFAIVHRLISRGYSVRLAVENQEDLDKLREVEMFGEMEQQGVSAVLANVMDEESLSRAMDGCDGVFHTCSFTDPSGLSGYTKHMAELEAKTAERVIETCVRTPTVRKCVFTSSLLACVWRRSSPPINHRLAAIVDENCWSDEAFCWDRKLWFALGKTMAEKAAWRAAWGRNLKLVTICPAMITGPGFRRQNSTASIAYLKGAHELLSNGLLSTVDVSFAADAHVRAYECMSSGTACGRYICFDHVIRRVEEAAELERQLGIPRRISPLMDAACSDNRSWFELSKRKLSRLMSSSRRCTYDVYSELH